MERRGGRSSRRLAREDLRDPRAHRRQGRRVRGGREPDHALGPHRRRQRRPRVVPAALAAQRHRAPRTTRTSRGTSRAWRRSSPGTDKPLTIGPDTPLADAAGRAPDDRASCAATTRRTRDQPQSVVGLNGNNIFSVASALQSASPSVIPIDHDRRRRRRHGAGRARVPRTSATATASSACSTARRRAPAACSRRRSDAHALQGALRRVHAAQPRGEPLDDEDRRTRPRRARRSSSARTSPAKLQITQADLDALRHRRQHARERRRRSAARSSSR